MDFVQNFPFFCIIFSMFSAIISFVFRAKGAKRMHLIMVCAVLILSLATLAYCMQTGESYTYTMGHYEAPWGNEIRIGPLEALMASFFALIMLLSVVGGMAHLDAEIQDSKKNLFYIILDLLMASLLALVYTNDLFTGYVFIEINTIAACGMIMIKKEGRTYACAIRYMIMSLVGSGLFLIGLSLLYGVTGHLLMSPAKEALAELVETNSYHIPMLVIIILITVGLCIKSGLYPFHTWIPDAYSYTTPACSAILSSLVCKGYIFLLIKIFYRVLGMESVLGSHITNIVFIFALIGMIMGSVNAIKQRDIRRMTAYSSVAQIGYIYMGIGLGTTAGVAAALFHILSHGSMKSLLFISISGLSDSSGGKTDFRSLRGSGHRNPLAGAAYTVAALSMVGMPLLAGFVSKYLFAASAAGTGLKMLPAWVVLAISTVLNAVYFMRTVLSIYRPDKKDAGVYEAEGAVQKEETVKETTVKERSVKEKSDKEETVKKGTVLEDLAQEHHSSATQLQTVNELYAVSSDSAQERPSGAAQGTADGKEEETARSTAAEENSAKKKRQLDYPALASSKTWVVGTVGLLLVVILLGVAAKPVIGIIEAGLAVFG